MPIERVFLGWDRPGLAAAVDYLVERFGAGESLDLGEVIVGVPGGRAGRRLLERLVDTAESGRRPLSPPQIATIGGLPERLYSPKRPFADPLTQQLAWVESLRRAPADRLGRLVPQPPAADDLAGWLSLGEMLSRLHRELAAEAMNFQDVADCGAGLRDFQEHDRWAALVEIQKDYLTTLDRLGLWDRQTARLFAARQGECRAEAPLVLVGTVDLNRLQRMMLEMVADRVTALVLAPPSMADRFDDLGCLIPEAWRDLPIALSDEQIDVVESPADQAAAVLQGITALGGRRAADEITVGVPDERIVSHLLQQFRQAGLRARHGVGESLTRTGPYRLLAAAADHLGQSRHGSFAALARHADLGRWIEDRGVEGDWLTQLDRYHADHLPWRIDGHWLGPAEESAALRAAHDAVETLLGPLSGAARPLGEWGRAVADVLVAVYGRRPLRPDDPADRAVLAACEKIHAALDVHRLIPAALAPRVSGAEAIRFALRAVAGETIAAPADAEAVELLGWLELPLDDAPVLIVTGMNEGIVPSSLGADLFLPNQMRRALGIEDNQRRWARDAYALCVLAASGRELTLIAGRRSPDGDPLAPSRLLLLSDARTTAQRVRRLFRGEGRAGLRPGLPGRLVAGRTTSGFTVPEPRALTEPVESMRVTEFRDYLACPYRYYLRHRLRLEGLDDRAEELDGGAFGSLVHDVLGEFGRSELAASTDVERIAAWLDAQLDRAVKRLHGGRPLPAVRIQAEQIRVRLRALAQWQASRASAGWRIEHVEQGPPPEEALLDVDGRPIGLRGRIDRIDVHEATGRRMVLDYKTSDRGESPEQSHRRQKSRWVDLQLPLYRHLVRGLGIDGPVGLGYIVLPRDVSKTGLLESEWTEAELADADETARGVVRDIRGGVFWPPADPPPAFCEEFAAICQDGQFGAAADQDNDDEEEETP